MKIRKTEIIAERERSVTVRFGSLRQEKFCAVCQRQTDFISVDCAALVCGTSSLTIFRRIENGRVHALETQ